MDSLLIPAIVLALTNIVFAALAARHWYRAEAAQREIARLVAQSRPRSPQPYETGLVDIPN